MPTGEIIGLGRSGIAAARLLNKNGWQVTIVDSATAAQVASRSNAQQLQTAQQKLEQEGVKVRLNSKVLAEDTPDLIVVSPGVSWDTEVLKTAREQQVETIGEIELAWRYLKQIPWVGITGTNGKTTTTALTAFIVTLREGFEAALVVGIVMACLKKAEQTQLYRWVYLGIFAGIIASVAEGCS